MANHDYIIGNQTFPATRTDLNNALSAIVTNNSSSSEPSTKYAYQWWYDISNTTLKFRNADNDAWVSFATFNMSNDTVNFLDSTVVFDIVGDTSPQLGGQLDVNGNAIGNGTLELLKFIETTSAVNELTITNNTTTNAPILSSTGDDTNIDLAITPKGSGNIVLDGIKFPNADGSADQVLKTDGSGNLSFTDVSGGIDWQSSIVTASTITVVAGRGYWINTTSNACTITLPGSASVGDQIIFVDYARTWATNAVTINQNSLKFQGNTSPNPIYNTKGQSVNLVYSGATQGWIPSVDDDVTFETPQSTTADFLVIAGGGGGGEGGNQGGAGGAGGYRNSFGSETSGGGGSSESTLTFNGGVTYTITVGAGGAGSASNTAGVNGANSSISGSDITDITSTGGGGGGGLSTGSAGGSGGGGGSESGAGARAGGSGTSNQGYAGGSWEHEQGVWEGAGGGGGAGGAGVNASQGSGGGNGGNGLASSITGSAVTRASGGGGASGGTAPTGGGGNGGADGSSDGTAGTANTGGGGGGANNTRTGGAGGSGVVILSMLDADYSGTTTGSPTVATGVSGKTVLTFTGSGSYTG